MGVLRCVGGCVPLFIFAILLDVLGLILLFIGIFANLRLDGRFYGDFLIYTGALVVFISLGCWLMWYVGNVPVRDDSAPQRSSSLAQLARKLSERLSRRLQGEEGVKCVQDEDRCSPAGSSPPRKAGRVTWGRSTAYSNQGYDDSMDSPKEDRKEPISDHGYDDSMDSPKEDRKEPISDHDYDDSMDSPKEDRKDTTT